MATIYIIKGPDNGGVFTLSDRACIVGRSDSCSVTLGDDRVSGSHLEISFDKDKGSYAAEDTKSTNGTWLNGRSMVDKTPLSDGDRLELGATVLEFTSKTFDSIDEAKAARTDTAYMAPPTLLDNENRPF